MLARLRARPAEPCRLLGTGNVYRLPHDGKFAETRAIDMPDGIEVLDLRVGENLIDTVHRPARPHRLRSTSRSKRRTAFG